MTAKEVEEIGADLATFLRIVKEAHDAPLVANCAVEMVKGMLKRHEKLRNYFWEVGEEDHLYDLEVEL